MEGILDNRKRIYVVEHLDPELGPWSALEYQAIARESASAGVSFCLSSVPTDLELPAELREMNSLIVEHQSVETVFKDDKERICLLDPKGKAELSPEDAEKFDVFLFGGILGDDPPRDRTSELRAKGFIGRRLGPVQMTTDTAVRVTRLVIEDKGFREAPKLFVRPLSCPVPLNDIPYIDEPELRIDEHESTVMPFRYVKDAEGKPIMPLVSVYLDNTICLTGDLTTRELKGMIDLIKKDSEKGFGDLL